MAEPRSPIAPDRRPLPCSGGRLLPAPDRLSARPRDLDGLPLCQSHQPFDQRLRRFRQFRDRPRRRTLLALPVADRCLDARLGGGRVRHRPRLSGRARAADPRAGCLPRADHHSLGHSHRGRRIDLDLDAHARLRRRQSLAGQARVARQALLLAGQSAIPPC